MSDNSQTTTTRSSLIPAGELRACDPDRLVTYRLHSIADAGALPRALELLAKRGLVPLSLHAERQGDQIVMTMAMDGLAMAESEHIGRTLSMIPLVTSVAMTVESLAATKRLRADSDLSRTAA